MDIELDLKNVDVKTWICIVMILVVSFGAIV